MKFDSSIKDYLSDIDEAPLLDWEQEQELARRIMEEYDPEARDTMVRCNLRLVVTIAKDFRGRGMSMADLIEEGNLGLIRAVDLFDPSHGVRFSSYASWWIKQSIKKSLLDNTSGMRIPGYMVELVNHWRHVWRELEADNGRCPTIEEMAVAMEMTEGKAKAVKDAAEMIDGGVHGDSDEDGISETVVDPNSGLPEDSITVDELLEKVLDLVDEIGDRESKVLKMRFGLKGEPALTLKQIGKELNLTRERVRQIQNDALHRLEEELDK